MATSKGQITKIYELRTLGYDVTHKQFESLHADLLKLRKAKIDLTNTKGKLVDTTEIAAAGKQIEIIKKKEVELVMKSAGAYAQLNEQYKQAEIRAKNMAAEFGTESLQFREAAANARSYKQELQEINNAVKGGGGITGGTPGVDRPNVEEVEQLSTALAEQGTVVNDLGIESAEAANAATAMGKGQKQLKVAVKQTSDEFKGITTPLEQYTGSLKANINRQLEYKRRLAEINTALKEGTGNTAALTLEKKFLTQADAELSQTINAQVKYVEAADNSYDRLNAELGISRNLLRQLSAEEKSSRFGLQLAKDIQVADAQLKKLDADMGNNQRNVGNYASGFNKAWSFLRNAAYLIPGLGIAGILGLITDAFGSLFSALFSGTKTVDKLAEKLQLLRDVMKEGNAQAGKDITTLKILYTAATNAGLATDVRKKAVKELKEEYPDYFKNIDDEIIMNGKAEKSYQKLTEAILNTARATAAKDKLEKIAAEKLDLETNITKIVNTRAREGERYKENANSFGEYVKGLLPDDKSGAAIAGLFIEADRKELDKASENRALAAFKLDKQRIRDLESQEAFLIKFVGAENLVEAAIGDPVGGKKEKDKKEKKGPTELQQLENERQLQLAIEKTHRIEIEKNRELTYNEEVKYNARIRDINTKYLTLKVNHLSSLKSLDKEQNLDRAQFIQERSAAELEYIEAQKELDRKVFQKADESAKIQLDTFKRSFQSINAAMMEDPSLNGEQRAQAQLNTSNAILAAEENYLLQLLQMESQYSEAAITAAREAVAKAKEVINKDSSALLLSSVGDLKKAGDLDIKNIEINMQRQRKVILDNTKLTAEQRKAQLDKLDKASRITILSKELDVLNSQVKIMERLLAQNLISRQEYIDKVAEQATKASQLSEAGTDKGPKKNIFGMDKGSAEDQALGTIISESYRFAQDAMNAYFDAERSRIQESLDANLDRLEREKEQAQAQAQSQAERDSLEKQFAAKKRKAEQEAGEQLKKSRKAEAKISLATELANIAASAAANPANGVTFGAAGAVMYGILSALALGRYALNVAAINREKFAYGGAVNPAGGVIGGSSHSWGGSPFNFEAERGEMNIIRTKQAKPGKLVAMGSHSQIASALNVVGGGVNFAPGGRIRSFQVGGSIGSSLQAPVFNPVISMGGESGQMIQAITAQAGAIESLKGMVLNLEVYQVTDSVTNAQKRRVSQRDIATL